MNDPLDFQRLPDVPDGPKPLDVACLQCGAHIGVGCDTGTGWGARTHAARWREVGVSKPAHEDRHRDYLDGQRRRLEAIRARPTPPWLLDVWARAALQSSD